MLLITIISMSIFIEHSKNEYILATGNYIKTFYLSSTTNGFYCPKKEIKYVEVGSTFQIHVILIFFFKCTHKWHNTSAHGGIYLRTLRWSHCYCITIGVIGSLISIFIQKITTSVPDYKTLLRKKICPFL